VVELSGRSAIVTGAGAGIGEAIARRLAAEGAAVTVVDIDEAGGRGTVEAIEAAGRRAVFARADVAEPDDVADMIAIAEKTHGPLELLVNNAGVVTGSQFPNCEPAAWMRVLDVNLRGSMLGTHLAVLAMRKHGRGGAIVNIASLAGVGLGPHPAPDYAATKAGVIRFTTALVSLANEGIRVNCVCPDWVDTPMSRRTRDTMSPAVRRGALPPELFSPDEIADAAFALIADDALAGRVMGCYCGRGNFRRLLPAEDGW
jgi:NAD(P)-dependent dehydrogenase (short-subunit alcohol dehydrogenase family)